MIHYLYIVFFRQCQFAGYGKISHFFGQVDNSFSGAAAPNRFPRGGAPRSESEIQ
jgi:hypothetical protein